MDSSTANDSGTLHSSVVSLTELTGAREPSVVCEQNRLGWHPLPGSSLWRLSQSQVGLAFWKQGPPLYTELRLERCSRLQAEVRPLGPPGSPPLPDPHSRELWVWREGGGQAAGVGQGSQVPEVFCIIVCYLELQRPILLMGVRI